MDKFKKTLVMSAFVALLGAIIGAATWLLLFIMNLGIDVVWALLPSNFQTVWYPVIVCVIGGLIIGFWERLFGPYPEELSTITSELKRGKKFPYNNLHIIAVAALLPLIFGGSLGPEAGLTGVIVGLCFWFSDRFKFALAEIKDISEIGMAATMSIIFKLPLFGFVNQVESDDEGNRLPKNAKIFMYFIAIIVGIGIFFLLSSLFGGTAGLGRFPDIETQGVNEWLLVIPLGLIGTALGMLFYIFQRVMRVLAFPLRKLLIPRAMLAGLILGGIGILLPYTMFSGEHQMSLIMQDWQTMGFWLLIGTGIVKLWISNVCLEMGWRGGNIFPVIFSGVCIGYAFALILPVDPVFCVAVVSAAVTTAVLRKPLAVVLLLLICFPISSIIPMIIGAVIGGVMPIPKILGFVDKQKAKPKKIKAQSSRKPREYPDIPVYEAVVETEEPEVVEDYEKVTGEENAEEGPKSIEVEEPYDIEAAKADPEA